MAVLRSLPPNIFEQVISTVTPQFMLARNETPDMMDLVGRLPPHPLAPFFPPLPWMFVWTDYLAELEARWKDKV